MNMRLRNHVDGYQKVAPTRYEPNDAQKTKESIFTQNVMIVVLPGFPLTELAACLDIFASANDLLQGLAYNPIVTSEQGGSICSASNLAVETNCAEAFDGTTDYLVFVGCQPTEINRQAIRRIVVSKRRFARSIFALSTAVDMLTDLNVLDQAEVSAHWQYKSQATEFATKTNQKLFHKSKGIVTSAGFLATFDVLLHCIANDHGWSFAGRISDHLIKDGIRYEDSPQRRPLERRTGARHKGLIAAVSVIEENLASPVPLSEVARIAGYSVRHLERQFQRHYRISPGRYYMSRRVTRAKAQIEQTTMSIIEVSMANGFGTPSHFARCFSRHFGISPHVL